MSTKAFTVIVNEKYMSFRYKYEGSFFIKNYRYFAKSCVASAGE